MFYLILDWFKSVTWKRLGAGFGGSLLLAVLGQVILANRISVFGGVGLYVISGVLFVFSLNKAGKLPPPNSEELSVLRRYLLPLVFGLVSLALLGDVLGRMDDPAYTGVQNYLTLGAWILSIVCFSAGVLISIRWRPPSMQDVRLFVQSHMWETVFVFTMLVVSISLRVYRLEQYPYPMLKDEGQLGAEAYRIALGETTNLFHTGWSEDPFMSSLPEAIVIRALGNTLLGVRLAPAVIGALTVFFLYFLVRAMFDRMTASLAVLCLFALPLHLHFSRLGVNNIFVGFWGTLILWLTYRAIQKGRPNDYLWAGLIVSLPLYSYLGSRLISALSVGILFYHALTQRGFLKANWKNLVIYALALILVAAPALYYSYCHPDLFLIKLRSDNIFSSQWLVSEPINSGRSIPEALLYQFQRSTMVFISESAWGGFYNSPKPYLPPIGAIAFILGMTYSFSRLRESRHLLLLVWFWGIVILGSALMTNPPSSERMVGSLPAVAAFVAISLTQAGGLLKRIHLIPAKLIYGVAVGLMVLVSVQGAVFYLRDYQQGRFFALRYEEFEVEVTEFVLSEGPDNRLYLLVELPLEAKYFPAHDYMTPNNEIQDLASVTQEDLDVLPRDKGMIFVATPERLTDLEEVARLLPGGQWLEVPRQPVPGEEDSMLYYSYQLSREQATLPWRAVLDPFIDVSQMEFKPRHE